MTESAQDIPRRLQTGLFTLFLALLVWAPLPFASNRPWASILLAVGMACLLLLWAGVAIALPERLRLSRSALLSLLCALIVALWALLQTRPEIVGLHEQLQPHPVWGWAHDFGLEVAPLLTIDAWSTRDALVKLIGYFAAFWLAFAMCQYSARARQLVQVLIAAGVGYAIYGLFNHYGGFNTILWEERQFYTDVVTSTFVNRNNYATYANLGVILCLGLILEKLLTARSLGEAKRIGRELLQNLLGKKVWMLISLVLLVAASLLTGSRGGMLSLLVSAVFMTLMMFLVTRPRLPMALLVVGLVLGLSAGAVALFGEVAWQRLMSLDAMTSELDAEGGGRMAIYDLSLRMLAERPWIGHGYGGYQQVFFLWRDERFPLVFDKAHNTYIEHLVELGIPATILLYLGPLTIFVGCVTALFVRRRSQMFPLVAATATLCVALHGLVDFSLQIPAVAVTFAAILGMGAAQSQRSEISKARSKGGQPAVPYREPAIGGVVSPAPA